MISIKARINLGDSELNKTNGDITPTDHINVSSPFNDILGQKKSTSSKGFVLGKSRLGQGNVYVNSLPYIIGRKLSNGNGNFATPYKITFYGTEMNSAIILFDVQNNAYPNSIEYTFSTNNGQTWSTKKTIYDNDARFELTFTSPANVVEVTISNWNKYYSPFVLMGVYVLASYEISDKTLISYSDEIIDRNNVEQPSYGIKSNTSNLTFLDFNNDILDLITLKILHSGSLVDIYLDNNEQVGEEVCTMAIQQLSYNNANNQVNLTLKDKLEDWQDINVEAVYYVPTEPSSKTAKYFYNYLYEKTLSLGNYNVLSFDELDTDTQNILNTISIEYPVLNSSSLWDEWDKLCALCFLHIYIDNTNTVIVKYLGGE